MLNTESNSPGITQWTCSAYNSPFFTSNQEVGSSPAILCNWEVHVHGTKAFCIPSKPFHSVTDQISGRRLYFAPSTPRFQSAVRVRTDPVSPPFATLASTLLLSGFCSISTSTWSNRTLVVRKRPQHFVNTFARRCWPHFKLYGFTQTLVGRIFKQTPVHFCQWITIQMPPLPDCSFISVTNILDFF